MEEATGAPSSLADWDPKRGRASGRGGETVMTESPSPLTMLFSRHTKGRPWTKEDVRTLKTLAREKTKTASIARKLKRSVDATRQKASVLGVTLGGGRERKGT